MERGLIGKGEQMEKSCEGGKVDYMKQKEDGEDTGFGKREIQSPVHLLSILCNPLLSLTPDFLSHLPFPNPVLLDVFILFHTCFIFT